MAVQCAPQASKEASSESNRETMKGGSDDTAHKRLVRDILVIPMNTLWEDVLQPINSQGVDHKTTNNSLSNPSHRGGGLCTLIGSSDVVTRR